MLVAYWQELDGPDPFVDNSVCDAQVRDALEWQQNLTALEVNRRREAIIRDIEERAAAQWKDGRRDAHFIRCDEEMRGVLWDANGYLLAELAAESKAVGAAAYRF